MTMLPPEITIRAAEERDLQELVQLYRAVHTVHVQARPDMFQEPARATWAAETCAASLTDPDQSLLVAEHAEAGLVGLAVTLLKRAPDTPIHVPRTWALLDALSVLPAWRHRGLGGALVVASIAWAESRGVREHTVAVHEFNADALRLYESLGYHASTRTLRRLSSRA